MGRIKIKVEVEITDKVSKEQREQLENFLDGIEMRILNYGDKLHLGMIGHDRSKSFLTGK